MELTSGYEFFPVGKSVAQLKIEELATLPDGWYHGEGVSPSNSTIQATLGTNRMAEQECLDTDAVPCLDGSIQLVVYKRYEVSDSYLEITIAEGEDINVTCYENQNGAWQITDDQDWDAAEDVDRIVKEFSRKGNKWDTISEYYESSGMLRTLADSPAQLFKTLGVEYQLFKRNVSLPRGNQYVTI